MPPLVRRRPSSQHQQQQKDQKQQQQQQPPPPPPLNALPSPLFCGVADHADAPLPGGGELIPSPPLPPQPQDLVLFPATAAERIRADGTWRLDREEARSRLAAQLDEIRARRAEFAHRQDNLGRRLREIEDEYRAVAREREETREKDLRLTARSRELGLEFARRWGRKPADMLAWYHERCQR